MAGVVERYLELALRLGKHDDDLVDSFYGSEELAARIEAEEPRDPVALAYEADGLLAELDDDPWLAAQVQALATNARKLAGEQFDYVEEGLLVYGIEPRWRGEETFEQAATLLDEALPGAGDVRDRYASWLEQTAIPAEILEQALLDVAAELRRLTRESIGLPEGEDYELELVTGERWLGYAEYLGGLRTRISINTDLPLPAGDIAHLTSHEIYGGHHTHRCWIEADLVRGQGQTERTLDLLYAPEAVISEGIAETGPSLVAGDGQELAAAVLGRLGLEYDAETGARVLEARELMRPVSANVAMLLHGRGASREEALDYATTWSLQPPERVEKLVDSQLRSGSPVYQHTYWQGRELVAAHVGGDPARLRGLMTARLRPGELG
ncbi:MAG TPA: hypothetical protein VFJ75_00505 [Gaiellaceae bacterium]|nr:hypothetical protein [Gaiellaceae bacterium]